MLKPFGQDIWITEGSSVTVAGFHYPTRCAVIRLADQSLLIWSPIKLTNALREAVDDLGQVTHLIAPNTLHHLFVSDWQAAYPDAKLCVAPGLRAKRPDLTVTAELDDKPHTAWVGDLVQVVVKNRLTTEVVFFHQPSKTVIFTDLLQQFPNDWHKGWRRIIAKLDLMVGDRPNVPRKFRLGFVNRRAARHSIDRILQWPAERVLMAHGQPVEADGQAILNQAFRWL